MTYMSKMDGPADLIGHKTNVKPVLLGHWVLQQGDHGGFLGQLAAIAKTDRGFPKHGDANAVRKRLGDTGADPEMFDAVDDAELDWTAL